MLWICGVMELWDSGSMAMWSVGAVGGGADHMDSVMGFIL